MNTFLSLSLPVVLRAALRSRPGAPPADASAPAGRRRALAARRPIPYLGLHGRGRTKPVSADTTPADADRARRTRDRRARGGGRTVRDGGRWVVLAAGESRGRLVPHAAPGMGMGTAADTAHAARGARPRRSWRHGRMAGTEAAGRNSVPPICGDM